MRQSTAILALALLGCAPDYETEHLRITTHFDFPLCEGDLVTYERMIDTSEREVGRQLDTPLDVELWTGVDWDEEALDRCGPDGPRACYQRGSHRILATLGDITMGHELVHAMTRRPTKSDLFFHEGAAVALSEATAFSWTRPQLTPRSGTIRYLGAGHFVRWLVEQRGWQCVRDVLSVNHDDAAAAFARSCGSSFDAAVEEFSTSAPWSYPSPLGCAFHGGEEHELGDSLLEFDVTIDCTSEDAHALEIGVEARHVLHVSSEGRRVVWTDADALAISRCETEPELLAQPYTLADDRLPPSIVVPTRVLVGRQFNLLQLERGDYLLGVISSSRGEPRAVSVRIEPAPPIVRVP